MKITIRKAIEADIKKVSWLWMDMCKELHPDYTPNMEWWRIVTVNLMRNHKEYTMFVSVNEKGQIVGFIDYIVDVEASRGQLIANGRHFYIKPEYRNTGADLIWKKMLENLQLRKVQLIIAPCAMGQEAFWSDRGFTQSSMVMEKSL